MITKLPLVCKINKKESVQGQCNEQKLDELKQFNLNNTYNSWDVSGYLAIFSH